MLGSQLVAGTVVSAEMQRLELRSDITQVSFINVRDQIDCPLEVGIFRAKALDTFITEAG